MKCICNSVFTTRAKGAYVMHVPVCLLNNKLVYSVIYIYTHAYAYTQTATLICLHIEFRVISISPPVCTQVLCCLSMQDIAVSTVAARSVACFPDHHMAQSNDHVGAGWATHRPTKFMLQSIAKKVNRCQISQTTVGVLTHTHTPARAQTHTHTKIEMTA